MKNLGKYLVKRIHTEIKQNQKRHRSQLEGLLMTKDRII